MEEFSSDGVRRSPPQLGEIQYKSEARLRGSFGGRRREREGFEPSVQLPVQRFSRPSHSTALASFLFKLKINIFFST